MGQIRGSLSLGVLPEVVRGLFLERASGALELTYGGDRASLQFAEGRLTHAETNIPGAHLGDLLVQAGFISRADRDAALELSALRQQRLGKTLVRTRLLTRDGLAQGLALQMREVFGRALAWPAGVYSFQPDDDGDGDFAKAVDPREALLDAAWSLVGERVLEDLIGDPRRRVLRATDERLSGLDLDLQPGDAFLLSRVDGASTAEDLILLMPGGPEEAKASLAGLLCAGAIEMEGAPDPISATTEVRRAQALALADRARAGDPFRTLGVGEHAATAEVRSAYISLLRSADPSSTTDETLRPLYRKIARQAEEAFQFVESKRAHAKPEPPPPRKRPPSVRKPAGGAGPRPRVTVSKPAETGGPAIPPSEAAEAASRAAADGRTLEALALYHQAIPGLSGRARRLARVGRAKTLFQTPNGDRLAEAELREATAEDPGNVDAWVTLGSVFERRGVAPLAISAYKRAVVLEPRNAAAREALQRLAGEPQPKAAAPSAIGRLFGRA